MTTGINYIKEKRAKIDYCNICGRIGELTWDHVPPKGVTGGRPVIVNTIFSKMPTPSSHMKKYQSGVKFRSVCQECNNTILGENDIVYQGFIRAINEQLLRQPDAESISVIVKINRLLRAMIGHALAAKNSYDSELASDRLMRYYMLNAQEKLPGVSVSVWLYPYDTIVITRDFVTHGHNEASHPTSMISAAIMAYPIAYMITDKKAECNVNCLESYATESIDEEKQITIDLSTAYVRNTADLKPYNWPVNVGDDVVNDAAFTIGGVAFRNDSRVGFKG